MSKLLIDYPKRTAPQPHYQHSRYGKPIISYYGWGGQLVTGMEGNLQPSAVILVDAQRKHGVVGVGCDVAAQWKDVIL